MQLSELLAALGEAEALGFREAEVTSVVTDSRRATEGSVFCALLGEHRDGAKYIEDAARRGAIAAITQRAEYPPLTQFVVPDVRAAMRMAAWALWGSSLDALRLAGITGTNGKTTTATLLREMLQRGSVSAGLITTLGIDLGGHVEPTGYTTPEAAELLGALASMARSQMQWAVVEVSSHALALGRIDGLEFSAAVFTNLTRDHLDFHGSMDAYLDAKGLLFETLRRDGTAVINMDDPHAAQIAARSAAPVLRTGTTDRCDLRVERIRAPGNDEPGLVRMSFESRVIECSWSLPGLHNLSNLASAAGAALSAGLTLDVICAAASEFEPVPGRLQRVVDPRGTRILVDYAHTPNALEVVLSSLRADTEDRLICVFGCGGDRDATKRPIMGRIAEQLSDVAIVTSDNPRTEDPETIIAQIMAGMSRPGDARVEPDRRAAIRAAINLASPRDTVLIAGKGHEPYQIVGTERHPFSDATVAAECIDEIIGGSRP